MRLITRTMWFISLLALLMLAPISCKQASKDAPSNAAQLASKDYGTRMRAIEQLMRSDVLTTSRFSDKTYAEIDRALSDFPNDSSRRSSKFLRQAQIQRQRTPESTIRPDKVVWGDIVDVFAKILDDEGIPK